MYGRAEFDLLNGLRKWCVFVAFGNVIVTSLQESDIELFSLLIDDGDLTDAAHVVGELAWMTNWIEIAGDLGATHARVIAGKAEPSEEALKMSVRGQMRLSLPRGSRPFVMRRTLKLLVESGNFNTLVPHCKGNNNQKRKGDKTTTEDDFLEAMQHK